MHVASNFLLYCKNKVALLSSKLPKMNTIRLIVTDLTFWTDPRVARLLSSKTSYVVESRTQLTATVVGIALRVTDPAESIRLDTLTTHPAESSDSTH